MRSVTIEPNSYASYISQEELDNLVRPRSFFASGHLSYADINFAEAELTRLISEKGFGNVESIADMTAVGAAVDIVFHISFSKARELVDKIIIINGVEELNKKLISTLKNCDNFNIKNNNFMPKQLFFARTKLLMTSVLSVISMNLTSMFT